MRRRYALRAVVKPNEHSGEAESACRRRRPTGAAWVTPLRSRSEVAIHQSDDSSVVPGGSVWGSPSWARAVATMFSVVNPNLACSTFIGADSPKVLMPMTVPVVPTQRSQPNGAGLLHRDPGRHRGRQDLVAVGRRLLVEQLHRRHAHHPRADPVGGELLVGLDGHRDLAAGGDEDDLGVALGRVGQDVGAAGDAGRGGVAAAVQGRQRLAGQHQRHRLVPDRHDHPPGLDDLVGVAGPHVDHAGHGADRGEVLDRLVGGPVLADADRVVGVDVDQRQLHQRREPQRAALEVGEDEEPGLVGAQLGQREPVADRGGGVLADPEVQVAPGPVVAR